MPRENKKRGRRVEGQKRKHQGDAAEDDPKRRRVNDALTVFTSNSISESADHGAEEYYGERFATDMPFYGLLDESEQEYFRQADSRIENNLFEDDEDRSLFLANVYKEVKGKELKMACSQSSSRLLERLISLSKLEQLKALFQEFCGQYGSSILTPLAYADRYRFMYLVQHRFASHCCETMFIHAAPFVTDDVSAYPKDLRSGDKAEESEETMENLFVTAVNELKGDIGFLMTDKFASHALRVLLLVLSGEPINKSPRGSLVYSNKKENKGYKGTDQSKEIILEKRRVPDSFVAALETMIRDSILNLDTNNLRALATHSTGNPMLQLLLRLELTHFGKQRARNEESILRKLVPDDPPAKGTESATFLDGLTYDPVGSRLLETIIEHAPGKTFKVLYRESWKYRMGSMVRNDVASYVAGTILKRLSKDDLKDAMDDILPQIPDLAERGRTAIIKTLVERCVVRDLNTTAIAEAIGAAYSTRNDTTTFSILKLLDFSAETDLATSNAGHEFEEKSPSSSNLHASLLAQCMLSVPGPLSDLILTSLQSLASAACVELAKHPTSSRVLQSALTSPHATVIFRRKLVQHLYGHIGELAVHACGSHVVDAVYRGTHPGLAFIRERCAEELAENEAALRDSSYGRAVWRNWKMDLYKRRRGEWVGQMTTECGNDGFLTFPADPSQAPGTAAATTSSSDARSPQASVGARESRGRSGGSGKSSIQLARERFAARNSLQNGRSLNKRGTRPEDDLTTARS